MASAQGLAFYASHVDEDGHDIIIHSPARTLAVACLSCRSKTDTPTHHSPSPTHTYTICTPQSAKQLQNWKSLHEKQKISNNNQESYQNSTKYLKKPIIMQKELDKINNKSKRLGQTLNNAQNLQKSAQKIENIEKVATAKRNVEKSKHMTYSFDKSKFQQNHLKSKREKTSSSSSWSAGDELTNVGCLRDLIFDVDSDSLSDWTVSAIDKPGQSQEATSNLNSKYSNKIVESEIGIKSDNSWLTMSNETLDTLKLSSANKELQINPAINDIETETVYFNENYNENSSSDDEVQLSSGSSTASNPNKNNSDNNDTITGFQRQPSISSLEFESQCDYSPRYFTHSVKCDNQIKDADAFNDAYNCWLAEKQKTIFEKNAQRRKEQILQRDQLELKRKASIECYNAWVQKKSKENLKEKIKANVSNEQLAKKGSKRLIDEHEAKARVDEWTRKKSREIAAKIAKEKREKEEKQKAEEERRRKAYLYWRVWSIDAEKKPRPVPLNKGLLSLRGTISKIFINENEWVN